MPFPLGISLVYLSRRWSSSKIDFDFHSTSLVKVVNSLKAYRPSPHPITLCFFLHCVAQTISQRLEAYGPVYTWYQIIPFIFEIPTSNRNSIQPQNLFQIIFWCAYGQNMTGADCGSIFACIMIGYYHITSVVWIGYWIFYAVITKLMWLQNIWNMLLFYIFIIQYCINIIFRIKKQQQKQTLFSPFCFNWHKIKVFLNFLFFLLLFSFQS